MTTYSKPSIKEVKDNVHQLLFPDGKIVYLVGTAHVSIESIDLVEETINKYRPDTICVELDDDRYMNMMKTNKYEDIDIIQILKKKQFFFFIGQFIMASFQKRISEKTGSKPGEEFRKAIELSEKNDASLVLADRNIGTTLKRAWRLTSFWQKMKLLGSLLASEEEDFDELNIKDLMKKDAIDSMVKSFGEGLPKTKEVLIDERDIYLTSEIQENMGKITVAIVGAGHVPGMLKQFDERVSEEIKDEIDFIPPPTIIGKVLPWIIPVLIISVFTWGFFYGRKEIAQEVAIFWIMANGILTSIGCLLAFGHPLTILVGFVAAPITSLNPTIGAGFVTALIQTFLVRPRVKDFEEIQKHSLKFKNWWSNRLTKIFLVFVFSYIGSTIGTFVALPALTKFFTG